MRVLVIDDEPMVRKIVRKMLERAGHQAVGAENGRVGIETLKTSDFDLVVTDIIMPEMEGIETLLAVREQFGAIPVVVMSGGGRTGNVDVLETAGRLGAAAMLQKPFTYDALLKAIDLGVGRERVA